MRDDMGPYGALGFGAKLLEADYIGVMKGETRRLRL